MFIFNIVHIHKTSLGWETTQKITRHFNEVPFCQSSNYFLIRNFENQALAQLENESSEEQPRFDVQRRINLNLFSWNKPKELRRASQAETEWNRTLSQKPLLPWEWHLQYGAELILLSPTSSISVPGQVSGVCLRVSRKVLHLIPLPISHLLTPYLCPLLPSLSIPVRHRIHTFESS